MAKKYNVYRCMNEITDYIDDQLDCEIDYEVLAKMMGVNALTMKKIFSILAGIPLTEYIRKRRLSIAGVELLEDDTKIIDVAFKYGYNNATSFSRAFASFHGIKPSQVTKMTKLKNYPKLCFDERTNFIEECSYEIVELPEMNLYGFSISVDNDSVHDLAPKHFQETEEKYMDTFGPVRYASVSYDNIERESCEKYTVLYERKILNSEELHIPKSRWLMFKVATQNAKDIQEISDQFYKEFLPSCRFNLRNLPELEYYHDGKTDFLVPII